MKEKLYDYLILLGDNLLILGHRLSELCGHGPSLETDIALTNLSLDLFGQIRNYFQYAASLTEGEKTEDDIAFLRYEHQYKNVLLVEQPNRDFAYVIARQFLFDAYHFPLLEGLKQSSDQQISAIAHKSIKEVQYHLRFSTTWMKRLGQGTEESHQRMQIAINDLWPLTRQLLTYIPLEEEMADQGIGVDLELIKAFYEKETQHVLNTCGLNFDLPAQVLPEGKLGYHTEHMGYILSELQYMQRTYPKMAW